MNALKLVLNATLGLLIMIPATASAQQRGLGGATNPGRGVGVGAAGFQAGNPGVGNNTFNNNTFNNNTINGQPFLNARERNAARVANTKIPEFNTNLGAVAPVYFGGFPGYGFGYPVPVYPGFYNPYPVYAAPIYPIPPRIPTNRTVNTMGPLMEAIGQAANARQGR